MTYAKIATELEDKFLKDFGPECQDFCLNCQTCQAWMAFEIICDAAGIEQWDSVSKESKK